MKKYQSNPFYALLCFAGAAYLVWQAVTGEGGILTWISAALMGASGALFLGAYFKLKALDQDESAKKENDDGT